EDQFDAGLEATDAPGGRRPNLAEDFIEDFKKRLGLEWIPDGMGDMKKTFGPEDVFHYTYAIFHAPTYRERYGEHLAIDFPRLPLTSDIKLFRVLCALGRELTGLHLMEEQADRVTSYPVDGENVVEKVTYKGPEGDQPGRVWINKTQYFEGVPPEVWDFHVGGYRVCDKWLKDRKSRNLTHADIQHYQNIVAALARTIELMSEIDNAIDKDGGWPIR
ncbi:MAG: DNA methyltransferase, partial [Alphaproteobacteria bacterium]|nr:DNA methyltransferase [Alphaproteobacteria bacterium]